MKPKIIAFPLAGIAYNDGLYAEFRAQGAEVVKGEWAGRWLISNLHSGDVVHIHWPSFFYASQGSIVEILRSFLRFLLLISIIRIRTKEIWWTAHNLMPHVRCRIPVLDTIARNVVIRYASRVFVHGEEAKKILLSKFQISPGKIVLIPHGHWISHYPACESKAQARINLDMPCESFIYLFFGQCKPYKNLEGLIEVFRKVARNDDALLVAGSFSDKTYLAKILAITADDPRIRIDHGFIPDDKVSEYLMACDVMCMPYREILTSGTTMLALSYGRPVLSINRGFLRDTVSSECGVLVEPGDSESLADGLRAMRAKSWVSAEIMQVAEKFTFHDAAKLSLLCIPQR